MGIILEWVTGAFLPSLLAGLLLTIGGFYFAKFKINRKAQNELNALVSLISTRRIDPSKTEYTIPGYNLNGNWNYLVKDHSGGYNHKGECKIKQYNNGTLKFYDGLRSETTKDSKKKIHEEPLKWSSLWAQVTTDNKIRAEYLITLDEEGPALGYFVLEPPVLPHKELKGDYHKLAPSLLFGEITFTKK